MITNSNVDQIVASIDLGKAQALISYGEEVVSMGLNLISEYLSNEGKELDFVQDEIVVANCLIELAKSNEIIVYSRNARVHDVIRQCKHCDKSISDQISKVLQLKEAINQNCRDITMHIKAANIAKENAKTPLEKENAEKIFPAVIARLDVFLRAMQNNEEALKKLYSSLLKEQRRINNESEKHKKMIA